MRFSPDVKSLQLTLLHGNQFQNDGWGIAHEDMSLGSAEPINLPMNAEMQTQCAWGEAKEQRQCVAKGLKWYEMESKKKKKAEEDEEHSVFLAITLEFVCTIFLHSSIVLAQ